VEPAITKCLCGLLFVLVIPTKNTWALKANFTAGVRLVVAKVIKFG
jgi:hypothetical protein